MMESLQILIKHGIAIDTSDEHGDTLLHYLPSTGNRPLKIEVYRILLKHGDKVNIMNHKGESPLYKAVDHTFPDAVRILLKYGADIRSCIHGRFHSFDHIHVDCRIILKRALGEREAAARKAAEEEARRKAEENAQKSFWRRLFGL